MSPTDKEAYDQASTIFSPDGRMYQVEYAREAIRRGGLAMGIRFKDGILFGIDKSVYNSLIEEDDLEKFYRITPTVGTAASGLIADTRVLVDLLREKAQEEKKRYGEEPDIKTLIGWVSSINEIYTRYEGVRPFGAALILGGKDEYGSHLYETDPSGIYQERTATAIGRGHTEGLAMLEKEHSLNITRDEAVQLALEVLKATFERIDQERNLGMELHIISESGYEKIDLTEDHVTGKTTLLGKKKAKSRKAPGKRETKKGKTPARKAKK